MAQASMSLAEAIRVGRRSNDPEKRAAFWRAVEMNEPESRAALEAARQETRLELQQRFGGIVKVAARVKAWFEKFRGTDEPSEPIDPMNLN